MPLKESVTYHHTTQSIASKVLYYAIKLAGIKKRLSRQNRTDKIRKTASPFPLKSTPDTITITRTEINQNNIFTLAPKSQGTSTHILYLHGGAFVISFAFLHWKFMYNLIEKTGCTIVAPDYPLSPEFSYKERFEMIDQVYKGLVKTSGAGNIIIMGDSAGGNIALSLAQKMRSENIPTPWQIILLSPWLDVSMSNPEIKKIDKKDPLISMAGSHLIQKSHAGSLD